MVTRKLRGADSEVGVSFLDTLTVGGYGELKDRAYRTSGCRRMLGIGVHSAQRWSWEPFCSLPC